MKYSTPIKGNPAVNINHDWPGFLASVMLAAGVLINACSAAARKGSESDDAGQGHPPDGSGASEERESQTRVPRSGQVDVRKIKPQKTPGGEPIVQPAPGLADPSVRLVQIARQNLAAETGRDISEIALVALEAVDWPDSSLGCPQEGRMYLQVITPGYRITLELEGMPYRYHTDRGSRVVYCPKK